MEEEDRELVYFLRGLAGIVGDRRVKEGEGKEAEEEAEIGEGVVGGNHKRPST